jgi:FemAB-related protein (PEP-CTERM system-associated)
MPDVRVAKDGAAWDAYVSKHPEATQYHRYEWPMVISRSFGHRPMSLVATESDRVVGVLPLVAMRTWFFGHFFVSLPFVNYGGVLADDEDTERALWERAVELARDEGAAYLESRHFHPHDFATKRRSHKVTMILSLEGSVESQWKGFDAKLRNQIRKAERSDLTVRMGGSEDVAHFYAVFARNMRDLGTPVYSRRFFEEVVSSFPESARVCTLWHGTTVVAGAIALTHRDTVEVPWASSRRDYRSMCPNNLLYWELMKDAIGRGLKNFDFGRCTPNGGTFHFKKQWGAQPQPLVWEYWVKDDQALPDLSPQSAKYRGVVQVWRHMPLTLANRLGPPLAQGIP